MVWCRRRSASNVIVKKWGRIAVALHMGWWPSLGQVSDGQFWKLSQWLCTWGGGPFKVKCPNYKWPAQLKWSMWDKFWPLNKLQLVWKYELLSSVNLGIAKIFWSSTKMHLWEPSIKSHRTSISINVTLVFTMLSNSVFGKALNRYPKIDFIR